MFSHMQLQCFPGSMEAPGNNFLVKGNAGQFGFYRVNYDDEGWRDIINLMNTSHKVLRINIEPI